MTRKDFKELLSKLKEARDYDNFLYNTKAFSEELFDKHQIVIDMLFKQILTEYGYDWLSWFVYETDFQEKKMEATDKKKLICQDEDGLYDYLKRKKYFKV